MTVCAASSASVLAVVRSTSLWSAHCPPPEGTKKFTMPALKKVKSGNVVGDATEVIALESRSIIPLACITPRIPK